MAARAGGGRLVITEGMAMDEQGIVVRLWQAMPLLWLLLLKCMVPLSSKTLRWMSGGKMDGRGAIRHGSVCRGGGKVGWSSGA